MLIADRPVFVDNCCGSIPPHQHNPGHRCRLQHDATCAIIRDKYINIKIDIKHLDSQMLKTVRDGERERGGPEILPGYIHTTNCSLYSCYLIKKHYWKCNISKNPYVGLLVD